MTIAAHANQLCPVYNVGSDKAILMDDLAKLIAQEFGVDTLIPEFRDAAIDRYVPSITKGRLQLGLILQHDLLESIQDTVCHINIPLKD